MEFPARVSQGSDRLNAVDPRRRFMVSATGVHAYTLRAIRLMDHAVDGVPSREDILELGDTLRQALVAMDALKNAANEFGKQYSCWSEL
jgi:hypothetical protein